MYCANPQCPDFLQWGIHGEYSEGITVCPKCRALLVIEQPVPAIGGVRQEPVAPQVPPPDGPLVTVASFNNRQDADLAVSMLLASGIYAVTAGDDCGRVDPGLGFGTRTRVLVGAMQLEAASALLGQAAPEGEFGGA